MEDQVYQKRNTIHIKHFVWPMQWQFCIEYETLARPYEPQRKAIPYHQIGPSSWSCLEFQLSLWQSNISSKTNFEPYVLEIGIQNLTSNMVTEYDGINIDHTLCNILTIDNFSIQLKSMRSSNCRGLEF